MKTNKKHYSMLTDVDKDLIVKTYYAYKKLKIKEMSDMLNISQRSIPRVLQERGINTRLKDRYVIKNENFFEYIDTEFKAYILGFIYADGFVGDNDNFTLSLTDKREETIKLLIELKKQLGITKEIRHSFDANGHGHYTLNFSSKKIVSDLNKLYVYPRKSLDMKKIPELIDEYYAHFIRGFFDGDGCYTLWFDTHDMRLRNSLELLGTFEVLTQIQEILTRNCNIKPVKLGTSHPKDLRVLAYKGDKSIKAIRDYMYKNAHYYYQYKYEMLSRLI